RVRAQPREGLLEDGAGATRERPREVALPVGELLGEARRAEARVDEEAHAEGLPVERRAAAELPQALDVDAALLCGRRVEEPARSRVGRRVVGGAALDALHHEEARAEGAPLRLAVP